VVKPVFVVPVADLERGPRTVTFTLDEAWLRQALEGTDATPRGPASATVELSKSGRDVMVRGRLDASLNMPCVVTLDPVEIAINPEIFLMLAPAGTDASVKVGKKSRREGSNGSPSEGRVSAGRKRGPKDELEEAEELDAKTAAQDTFEGSQIELDPFFREFLVLELPMFPRRSDLPSPEGPAIGPPSATSEGQEPVIDPRLQPLAALRSRLREKE
jgi:uncharacterized metal-binding protein YceD (DUF177 family)